jgi:hypothetical protein
MYNAGDYNTGSTVCIPFNTFTSDDPSLSVTVTQLAVGDIEIHKDGYVVQRASDNGVAVQIDFDGVTGNHIVTIYTGDDSDAGFYENGSRYQVRLEGIDVDGATLNVFIGTFSIGCTIFNSTGASLATNPWSAAVESACARALEFMVGTTGASLTAVPWNPNWDAEVQSEVEDATGATLTAILGDSNELQSDNIPGTLATIAGYIDTEITTIGASVQAGLDSTGTTLTAIPWNSAWNAAALGVSVTAILGDTFNNATDSLEAIRDRGDSAWITGAGGSPGEITGACIIAIKTEIATGATLTAIPWNASWDSEVQSEVEDATGASLTAIKAVTDALTVAAATKLAASANTMITGTVGATDLTTTTCSTDISLTDAEQLNGRIIIFAHDTTTAGLKYQATNITDFVVANGVLTFTAVTTAPSAGDTFVVL